MSLCIFYECLDLDGKIGYNELYFCGYTKENEEKMKKYHPIWVIVGLIIRGLVVFSLSVLAGIWIAHGLGVGFKKWGACPNYFADFLGGALGLTLGFVLDKISIERISHVSKYMQLIKIVKKELYGIKEVVYKNEEQTHTLLTENDKLDHKLMKVTSIDCESKGDGSLTFTVNFDDPKSIQTAIYQLNNNKYNNINNIHEYIFDDFVTNAETMSILANLPLAPSKYNEDLITQLCYVQKYVERFKKSDGVDKKRNWLFLQYYINKVTEVL